MKSERKDRVVQDAHSIGKDEMNLLEYCIFSANDRVDRKTKSVVFEDRVAGQSRKLTVAFSAEYGRPTVRDDQVLIALLKLTRDQGFGSPTVHFSRYEVIRVLGWPSTGHYYKQIEHALDRIRGTTLNWENAYWDHRAKEWATRKFSIIDDVELLDRGRYDRIREASDEKQPKSNFRWSSVMFESFAAGYIKTLDLDQFRMIQGDVAKRLYRWLDKHFKNPRRKFPIELPLEQLAVQKLGFRRAAPSHLRRMVIPAIEELERSGIVKPENARFSRKQGKLQVHFRPERRIVPREGEPRGELATSAALAQQLIDRGVVPRTAERLADVAPEESERQIELFDHRVSAGWRPRGSPGGYLKEAIERKFSGPPGFETSRERASRRAAADHREAAKREEATEHEQEADQGRKAHLHRLHAVEEWKASMSDGEWKHTEDAIVSKIGASEVARYRISRLEQTRVLFAHLQEATADRIADPSRCVNEGP